MSGIQTDQRRYRLLRSNREEAMGAVRRSADKEADVVVAMHLSPSDSWIPLPKVAGHPNSVKGNKANALSSRPD